MLTAPSSEGSLNDELRQRSVREYQGIDGKKHRVSLGANALVAPDAKFKRGVAVGKNSQIGEGCEISSSIGQNVQAGDHVTVAPRCRIGVPSALPLDQEHRIIIEDYATLKSGVRIHPFARIGVRALLEAQSIIGRLPDSAKEKRRTETSVGADSIVGRGAVLFAGVQLGINNHVSAETVLPSGLIVPDNYEEKIQVVDENFVKELLGEKSEALSEDSSLEVIQPGEITITQLADKLHLTKAKIDRTIRERKIPQLGQLQKRLKASGRKQTTSVLSLRQQAEIQEYFGL